MGEGGATVNGWEDDKHWSDRFIPEMKRILGEHLIGEAPVEEDRERNTDLVVLLVKPARIACRVRTPGYFPAYAHEFTIRSARQAATTELAKVMAGWGDFMLYGFADTSGQALCRWTLLDLSAFRLWVNTYMVVHPGRFPGEEKMNPDKSSMFRIFEIADIPGIVKASSTQQMQDY
jgi:hypothetical protein